MSQVDGTDFERLDPPDALWGRITEELARTPTGPGTAVEYSINADDAVIAVDEGWAAFAPDNEAPRGGTRRLLSGRLVG